MMDLKRINDRITVGGQPTAPDIEQLKKEGFRTIVNLRADGEDDQPMNPEEEGRAVKKAGMKYVRLPVSGATMGPDIVDKFREQVADFEGPVLVHCHAGTRAGAFTMMATAVKEGWSGDDTLEKAKAWGVADRNGFRAAAKYPTPPAIVKAEPPSVPCAKPRFSHHSSGRSQLPFSSLPMFTATGGSFLSASLDVRND